MTTDLLFIAGTAVLFVSVVSAMIGTMRERWALSSFVSAMTRWGERRPDAGPEQEVVRLPPECHIAATRLTEGLKSGSDLDDAVTRALTAIADSPLRPSLVASLGTDIALLAFSLAPAIVGLLAAAIQIAQLAALPDAPAAHTYVLQIESLPSVFETVREGFGHSAVLTAGLFVVWSLRWWLLRPEAREARMVQAILRAAIAARPGTATRVAAGVANLLAPPRCGALAVRSTVAFVVLFGSAWFLVTGHTPLRVDNSGPLSFQIWPQRRVSATSAVRAFMPRYAAGSPIAPIGASMIIDLFKARLAQKLMVSLTDGRLVDDNWRTQADDISAVLENFREPNTPLELLVLSHRDAPAQTAISLMRFLGVRRRIERFHLVLERAVPSRVEGQRSTDVQSGLRVSISPRDDANRAPIELTVGPRSVRIAQAGGETLELSLVARDWPIVVQRLVRNATGVGSGNAASVDPRVLVDSKGGVTYDKFVAVLSAADSACEVTTDCGLPGLGLEFIIERR